MKYSILIVLFLLTACVSPEEIQRRNEQEALMSPRERCMKDADDFAGSCQLICLKMIFSKDPYGQICSSQCDQKKLTYYQACSYK